MKTFRNLAPYAIIFATVCVLIGPVVYYGIPDNHDLPEHLRFARSYLEAFTPHWAAADNLGFGSVGIRFYPPVAHTFMAIVQGATHSWYDTLWITMFVMMLLASFGAYFLASEWLPKNYALGAALLYAIVPYHLVEVYQAFLLSEFTASAVLPFCFLFAYRTAMVGRFRDALLFSLSLSVLIISHIPSTIIGTLSLGVFVLCLLERKTLVRTISRFALAFAVSFAATAFYWVRFVSELSWVKHNTEEFYAKGFYDYATYLFPMYFSGGDAYISRFLWMWDIIVVITLLLLVPFAVYLISAIRTKENPERHLIAFGVTAAFAAFMASLLSKPIWDNISIIQKLQFPWRWLSVLSLAGTMCFVFGVYHIAKDREKISRLLGYSLAAAVICIIIFDITQAIIPSAPVSREQLSARVAILDDEAACKCWWPIWAEKAAFDNKEKVTAPGRDVHIADWENTARDFDVSEGAETKARIATFYYPHWQADVNGNAVTIAKADDGTMLIPLPAGSSHVTLTFREPPLYRAAAVISAAAWVALILLLIFFSIKRDSTSQDR